MAGSPVYSFRLKVAMVVVLTLATAAFVGAYLVMQDGTSDPIVASGGAADAVEALLPARGQQVPQQTTVGIDLAGGWDATLTLNETAIPTDQLNVTSELALVQYTPSSGKVVESLRPGENCVAATVWPLAEGMGGPSTRTVRWCFEVV